MSVCATLLTEKTSTKNNGNNCLKDQIIKNIGTQCVSKSNNPNLHYSPHTKQEFSLLKSISRHAHAIRSNIRGKPSTCQKHDFFGLGFRLSQSIFPSVGLSLCLSLTLSVLAFFSSGNLSLILSVSLSVYMSVFRCTVLSL